MAERAAGRGVPVRGEPRPAGRARSCTRRWTACCRTSGLWRGRGKGGFPTIEDFDYAQEIRISHDGRPFLHYESRAWILDEQSKPVRPAGREVGWWRPVLVDGRATDELEALLTTPTGIMELHLGKRTGTQVEFATDAVMRTPTAKEVTGGHRLFGIVEGALLYAQEMAAMGHAAQPAPLGPPDPGRRLTLQRGPACRSYIRRVFLTQRSRREAQQLL